MAESFEVFQADLEDRIKAGWEMAYTSQLVGMVVCVLAVSIGGFATSYPPLYWLFGSPVTGLVIAVILFVIGAFIWIRGWLLTDTIRKCQAVRIRDLAFQAQSEEFQEKTSEESIERRDSAEDS